jgi:hypothetical protein
VKLYHQPSGLHDGLNLLIDSRWSPDQAPAVIELLDDLRDRIWTHYEVALQTRFRELRVTCCDVETTPIRRTKLT